MHIPNLVCQCANHYTSANAEFIFHLWILFITEYVCMGLQLSIDIYVLSQILLYLKKFLNVTLISLKIIFIENTKELYIKNKL